MHQNISVPFKNTKSPTGVRSGTRLRKIAGIFVIVGVVVIVVLSIVVYHAEPLLRARVVETLSARFGSRVELDELKVSVYRGLLISAKGLRVYGKADPNIHDEGMQPLIAVDEFHFRTGVLSMLRTPMHVETVYIKGLELNIPPKGDRQQLTPMAPQGKMTIKIKVAEFHLEKAHLIINTNRPDKLPLDFDIQDLSMRDIGPDQPLSFIATLVNPKPIGNIASHGEFGPFDSEDPRESRVGGEYTFSNADLGTLKGIGGILSSTGRYEGTIGRIVVDGQTDTPDFRLNISGRAVPLKTVFHAVVDGTSGDTYLQPVNATILSTPLTSFGFVIQSADPKGHHIQLDATVSKGKIEDLLKLAVQTDPPVMTGTVHLQTRIDLPAGNRDLSARLRLQGKFEVLGVHFSNDKIQTKVDALSMRSQGKPHLANDDVPDNVKSRFGGNFVLRDSVLSFPNLVFQMPGTRVDLLGNYSLDGKQVDFHGHARFEARLSQMVGGWKSIFLRPVNPFLSKNGAGTEIPIKITGTKSEPHFGLDLFKDKKQRASENGK